MVTRLAQTDAPENPPLSPRDHQVLKVRAISPAVRDDRGYRTVNAEEAAAYGFLGDQARDGMLVPCHNTQGFNGAYQLRPHEPRLNEHGKPIKYEWPAGKKLTVDVPLAAQPLLDNTEIPLLITESPMKADAIMSAAEPGTVCAIAVIGVWGWRSGGAPLSDFRDIPLCTKQGDRIKAHRRVVILFDSDTATNPKVTYARQDLTEFLGRRGATVDHVDIPANALGEKQGIDDALANGHKLGHLLATAHRPRPIDPALAEVDPDRQRIADLELECAKWETAYRTERAARMEEHRTLGDKRRPAQERIAAVLFAFELRRVQQHGGGKLGLGHDRPDVQAVDSTGAIVVSIQKAAETAGTSPKNMGDYLSKWAGEGVIDRPPATRIRTGERVDARGEIKVAFESTARIRPRGDLGSFLADLSKTAPEPTPREKRVPANRCADHPTADLLRTTTTVCGVCAKPVAPERKAMLKAGTPPDVDPDPSQNTPQVISEDDGVDVSSSSPPTSSLSHRRLFQSAQAALSDVDHASPGDRGARMELADHLAAIARSRGRKPDPKPPKSAAPPSQGVPF